MQKQKWEVSLGNLYLTLCKVKTATIQLHWGRIYLGDIFQQVDYLIDTLNKQQGKLLAKLNVQQLYASWYWWNSTALRTTQKKIWYLRKINCVKQEAFSNSTVKRKENEKELVDFLRYKQKYEYKIKGIDSKSIPLTWCLHQ